MLPPSNDVIVMSNPPFIGMAWLSADQQADNRIAFENKGTKGLRTGRLDYVACWYAKAVDYLKGTRGRCAFVSTNSITQGEQARTLLPFLQHHGFDIDFAHRTFRGSSEAPGAAAVHVVIIGFSEGGLAKRKRLFDYPDIGGEPVEVEASRINFYLVDAPDVAPAKRTSPWLSNLPTMTQGSKPWDGGHLLVEETDYVEACADAIAVKYLREFRQAADMLYSKPRWCLWLVDASPSDLRSSPYHKEAS